MHEVEIKALLVDPVHNSPVILLKDRQSDMVVPVWIGNPEATAIAMELQNKIFPRPLTHDLLKEAIIALGGEVEKVIIDHIQDGTYYATIFIQDSEGNIQELDARPSDTVALALRMNSPIYISDEVFEASAIELPLAEDDEELERFKQFVEKIDLAEFKRLSQ